jgi:hypothetical protein
MDIIDILVYFVIFFNICIFIWIVDILLLKPFMFLFFGDGNFGIIGETCYKIVTTVSSSFPSYTLSVYFMITIFFLIMYFIYLFIIFVIPETGFATLFIPVRELLLAIPPMPSLINKGIFNFYKSIFNVLGFSGDPSLSNFSREYFYFSKDGTYEIIGLFNPHLDMDKVDEVIEDMNNNNKKSEIKNLKKDVEVCTYGNSDFTPPNIDYTGILKNNMNDAKNSIKCNLKSITPYIQTETGDIQAETNDIKNEI